MQFKHSKQSVGLVEVGKQKKTTLLNATKQFSKGKSTDTCRARKREQKPCTQLSWLSKTTLHFSLAIQLLYYNK